MGPGQGPSGLMGFEVRPALQRWHKDAAPAWRRQSSPSTPASRGGGTGVPRQDGGDGAPGSPRQHREQCQGCHQADLGDTNGSGGEQEVTWGVQWCPSSAHIESSLGVVEEDAVMPAACAEHPTFPRSMGELSWGSFPPCPPRGEGYKTLPPGGEGPVGPVLMVWGQTRGEQEQKGGCLSPSLALNAHLAAGQRCAGEPPMIARV